MIQNYLSRIRIELACFLMQSLSPRITLPFVTTPNLTDSHRNWFIQRLPSKTGSLTTSLSSWVPFDLGLDLQLAVSYN